MQMINDWAVTQKTIEDAVQNAVLTSELRADIDSELAAALISGGLKQFITKKIFIDRVGIEEINHEGIAKLILNGLV